MEIGTIASFYILLVMSIIGFLYFLSRCFFYRHILTKIVAAILISGLQIFGQFAGVLIGRFNLLYFILPLLTYLVIAILVLFDSGKEIGKLQGVERYLKLRRNR